MFHDRDRHATTPARETALDCLEAGIAAARPERVVAESVGLDDGTLRILDADYDLAAYDELLVIGGGKAAGGVAAALETILGNRIDGGVVVATDVDRDATTERIDVREGDHPAPTERNVAATTDLLKRAESAGDGTLVLAIVTGGASALLCAPAGSSSGPEGGSNPGAGGLTLEDLRGTTEALLDSGARIDEVNAVRRRLSAIKGGRLTAAAAPATVLTLALSDVVGDDPAVIGSGPTVPDPTTAADALAVFDRYGIRGEVPSTVLYHLEAKASETAEASPEVEDRAGEETTTDGATADGTPGGDLDDYHLLATGRTAIDAARAVAAERGYDAMVLSSRLRGEAGEVGRVHAAVAEEIRAAGDPLEPPAIVLSGGEVTVTVEGRGSGGPNQELSLAAGVEFATGETDAVLASVDTDGIDGPTEAAGAIVDGRTVPCGDGTTAAGGDGETVAGGDEAPVAVDVDDARAALLENDAGPYLAERGALLETGSTGTNVNDLRVLVVGESD